METSALPQIPGALLCPEDAVIHSAKTPVLLALTPLVQRSVSHKGAALSPLSPRRGWVSAGRCRLSRSLKPPLHADTQGASKHHAHQINYSYTKHRLCQLGTAACPGNGGVPTFTTSRGKGEILHHTSDSHFNRRNGLFCQNFPHTFAAICQGLSCRLSGLQRDTASFSLPCLRQRRDPPCRSSLPPTASAGRWCRDQTVPGRCFRQRLWATSCLPSLAQPMLCRCRGGFWGLPAPGAGSGCGCTRLRWCGAAAAPGGPVGMVRGTAALPIPALPRGPAGPRLLRSWEEDQ